MRTLYISLLFVAGCVTSGPVSQPNPPAPVPPVAVVPAPLPAPTGKKVALLVGINKYGGGNDLSGCVNDVEDVKAELLKRGGWEIRLLLDQQATAAAVRDGAKRLREEAKAGSEILLWLSGHGTTLSDPSDPDDGADEAFCAADILVGDFASHCIRGSEFRQWLSKVPDGVRVSVVSDSCFSGTEVRAISKTRPRFLPAPATSAPKPASRQRAFAPRDVRSTVAFISGCRKDQTSADAWFDGRANGALSRAAIDAGVLANKPLGEAVAAVLTRLSADGFSQIPQLTAPDRRKAETLLGR